MTKHREFLLYKTLSPQNPFKVNIFNYQYINEVRIVFFPCLFEKSKKIHRQVPAIRSLSRF